MMLIKYETIRGDSVKFYITDDAKRVSMLLKPSITELERKFHVQDVVYERFYRTGGAVICFVGDHIGLKKIEEIRADILDELSDNSTFYGIAYHRKKRLTLLDYIRQLDEFAENWKKGRDCRNLDP
jgi:hypothetical protein